MPYWSKYFQCLDIVRSVFTSQAVCLACGGSGRLGCFLIFSGGIASKASNNSSNISNNNLDGYRSWLAKTYWSTSLTRNREFNFHIIFLSSLNPKSPKHSYLSGRFRIRDAEKQTSYLISKFMQNKCIICNIFLRNVAKTAKNRCAIFHYQIQNKYEWPHDNAQTKGTRIDCLHKTTISALNPSFWTKNNDVFGGRKLSEAFCDKVAVP